MNTISYNKKIDILKAVAIISAVLGHSIQFGSGEQVLNMGAYFDNIIFKVIYSFHMPLFMLISGYLFYFSMKKYTFIQLIFSRITTLIIPILAWSVIPFCVEVYKMREISFVNIFRIYIKSMLDTLWFLWAIFYCSMVVLLINRFMKDNVLIYLTIFIVSFFVTDSYNFSLYKYMYPYFLFGYFYNKYSKRISKFEKLITKKIFFQVLLCVIYFIMFGMYTRESYIYTTGYMLWGKDWSYQLEIDIYRLAIGVVGSSVVILFVDFISTKMSEKVLGVVTYIGKNSLGIYIVSGLCFSYILPEITRNVQIINYFVVLSEASIIVFCSLIVVNLIKKSVFLNKILFGGRT